MKKNERGEKRKKEIMNAAVSVFLEKGIAACNMEDIIAKTNLSKGGVYYYYKNKSEIIYDIFIDQNRHRINVMKEYIEENNYRAEDLKNIDIMADLITSKILVNNQFMHIYVNFLLQVKFNEDYRKIYEKILSQSKKELKSFFSQSDEVAFNDNNFEFITRIIHSFYFSSYLLDANPCLQKNKETIKEMIKVAISNFK